MNSWQLGALSLAATLGLRVTSVAAFTDDATAVADLDTRYQKAVKENDAITMGRILHDEFVLVVGNGASFVKAELMEDARTKSTIYEQQDEEPGTQIVHVWGDTAVVTAKLWIKGKNAKGAFERKLWFSDTYVRTPTGWRYVFGQASLPLPP